MTTATIEWRIQFGADEKRFSDREDMRSSIRAYLSERASNHASYLIQSATNGDYDYGDENNRNLLHRMNNAQRFLLNITEFFSNFDDEFDRQVCGNIMSFEIKTGNMVSIEVSGLAYSR